MKSNALACKVSKKSTEIVESGLLEDGRTAVRTTILVDISESIPEDMRGKVKSYIGAIIKNMGKKSSAD